MPDDSDSIPRPPRLLAISAVTLATADMARALRFYRALGFEVVLGGASADFTSLAVGEGFLNLFRRGAALEGAPPSGSRARWGRIIFHVSDVDAFHARAVAAGLHPEARPRDASWGERYFHIVDPDGHELSFARPLAWGRGGEGHG